MTRLAFTLLKYPLDFTCWIGKVGVTVLYKLSLVEIKFLCPASTGLWQSCMGIRSTKLKTDPEV